MEWGVGLSSSWGVKKASLRGGMWEGWRKTSLGNSKGGILGQGNVTPKGPEGKKDSVYSRTQTNSDVWSWDHEEQEEAVRQKLEKSSPREVVHWAHSRPSVNMGSKQMFWLVESNLISKRNDCKDPFFFSDSSLQTPKERKKKSNRVPCLLWTTKLTEPLWEGNSTLRILLHYSHPPQGRMPCLNAIQANIVSPREATNDSTATKVLQGQHHFISLSYINKHKPHTSRKNAGISQVSY